MMESLRKIPPNLSELPDRERLIASEMLYRSQSRNSFGHSPDSPLLKAKKGVDEQIRRRTR